MVDYELITVLNEGSPIAEMICMTVSENRVGLYWPVLDALDRPDMIMIHRGVKTNEGKLVIEGTDDTYGSIPIDYERKRVSFFNKVFVGLCKEMVEKYGGGKFKKGIFFTVKGELVEENMVVFDFYDVMYREVKVYARTKTDTGKYTSGKQKTVARGTGRTKSTHARSTGAGQATQEAERKAFNTSMGFSIPNMKAAIGGIADKDVDRCGL